MKTLSARLEIASVTLNPAIDRTVTISDFAAGAVNRVDAVQDGPGGKGVNVASALADWGLRAGVTGFLGRDNAEFFEELFARKKIEDRFVRIDGRTRVGIKITDPVRKQTTDINFPGLAPEPADVAALHETLAAMESDWWVVAGSVPLGVEPFIYREIVGTLKARGCKVVLDASGEALSTAIEAGPHIVKPNIHELQMLMGRPLAAREDVIRAARELLAKGIEMVVVSMGKEGACFVTAREAIIARSPDVEVKSTVGAGDAMVAGILAAQIGRLSVENSARLASAFSLQALTRVESGMPSRAILEEAMNEIIVNRVGSST